jgi:hypothetical protein
VTRDIRPPEPRAIAEMVEEYATSEVRDAQKYTNRTPLDDSGVWSLHDLAARIYAMGHEDGRQLAEFTHKSGARLRAGVLEDGPAPT